MLNTVRRSFITTLLPALRHFRAVSNHLEIKLKCLVEDYLIRGYEPA